MECLRTPLGGWAKGVKTDGERGGELSVSDGMTLSCWDSRVAPISWLLGEAMDPSVGWGRRELYNVNLTFDLRVLGCSYLCLCVLHHAFSLFETPRIFSHLTDAVSSYSSALCSSAMSCSEYLQAVCNVRLILTFLKLNMLLKKRLETLFQSIISPFQ